MMINHLDDEQLIDLLYDLTPEGKREAIAQHVTVCETCRTRLAEQQALQQRVTQTIVARRALIRPSARMQFAAIAPGLKRSRTTGHLLHQSSQLLTGAVTLTVLLAVGIGLYALFSGFSQPGNILQEEAIEPAASPAIALQQAPRFVWQIDGAPNRLNQPSGLGIDAQDNIYVVDTGHSRIQKFDREGRFLMMFGRPGSGDGEFDFAAKATHPGGDVAVDSQGNIYVADFGNARIQKFDHQGRFISQWGSFATGAGQFNQPTKLVIDRLDNIYVLDEGSSIIHQFDTNGQFLTTWGSNGVQDGQFVTLGYGAVDAQGHLYIADVGSNRIQKFNSSGQFLLKWGSAGGEDGQFFAATGVALDRAGRVYVTDSGNPSVQIFDEQGQFLFRWGSRGNGEGQFGAPIDLVFDSQGNIYISDSDNDNIQKFRP